MRIVAGAFGGRRLHMPSGGARPTSERVREAMFDILGQSLDGESVLDLYAGSGALGIEALSRGARRVTFVEKLAQNATVIKKNLLQIGCMQQASLLSLAVETFVQRYADERYDVIFADPPYAQMPQMPFWLNVVATLLAENGVLVLESATRAPVRWTESELDIDERRYGDTTVTFVRQRVTHE